MRVSWSSFRPLRSVSSRAVFRRARSKLPVKNDSHKWPYQSKFNPEDVVLLNIYDNHGRPSIAHNPLDLVEDSTIQVSRVSIESRTLVQY